MQKATKHKSNEEEHSHLLKKPRSMQNRAGRFNAALLFCRILPKFL
jgi:hypothetical protein